MGRRGLPPPPVRPEGSQPRCGACLSIPGVIYVHRDERRKAQRGPVCSYCGFRPEVIVTDDEADRSVVGPGEFGGK